MKSRSINTTVFRARAARQFFRAVRNSIESLERRVFLSSSMLYTVPDGGTHALVLSLVSVNGTPTIQLSDNGAVQQQALAATSGVAINGGTGNDSLAVDFSGGNPIPSGVSLAFDGGAGVNSLTLENASFSSETYNPSDAASGTISLDASSVSYLNLSSVTDTVAAGSLTMTLSPSNQSVTLGNGSAGTAEFSSGSAAFVTTDFANKADVTLNANGGNDTVTLQNTVAAGTNSFTLEGNAGSVAVNVLATAAGVSTEITSYEGGPQTIVIGGPTSGVQNILGPVDASDNTGGEDVTIDDSADTVGRTIVFDRSSVTGIAPAPITWMESALNSVTLDGGSGGNRFTVATTPTSVPTTLNLGTGNNTALVQSVLGGSVLNVNGQGGHDAVTVAMSVFANYGNETGFQTLIGTTNVTNPGGTTDLTVDASTIANAQTVTVNSASVAISTTVPAGPATSGVNYTLAGNSTLTVGSGAGDDALTLNSVSIATTLNGNAGSDTFVVTPSSVAPVTVNGGDPAPPSSPGDTLNVNLAATTGALTSSTLTATGYQGVYTFTNAQPVHFSGIETFNGAAPAVADLVLSLSAPSAVNEFGNFTCSFTVTNKGPTDATNTILKDVLPSVATLLSSSVPGAVTNGILTLNLGTVANGATVGGTLTFSVGPDGSTAINAAGVSSDITDPTPADDSGKTFTDVVDPALVGQGGFALSGVEGNQFVATTLARFVDPAPAEPGDYTATVDWGDGSTGAVGIVSDGAGGYLVTGTHAYAEEGQYSVVVTIKDGATPTVINDSATVSDPNVSAAGVAALSLSSGTSSGLQAVATFTDPGGAEDPTLPGNYSATINWGDGTSSAGVVAFNAQTQTFSVSGAHTYAAGGDFTAGVSVVHRSLAPVVVSDVVHVADAQQPPTLGNVTITSTINEGGTAHLTGSLSEGVGGGTLTLSVNWGPGQLPGVYTFSEGTTTFNVTHVYADNPVAPATSFPVGLVLTNVASTKTSTASTSIVVNDVAPVAGSLFGPANSVRGQGVAFADTFTDAGVLDTHTASFSWGDGTSSAAVVTEAGGSGSVAASHVFKADGTYKVSLTVTDKDGLSTTVSKTVTVSSQLVVPDPAFGGTMLVVGGTSGGSININATRGGSILHVVSNGIATDVPNTVDRIVIYGQGNNDSIQLSNNVTDNAFLYGGAGGTVLVGGGGNNVLVGGAGNDLLVGGAGRNVIIGGGGSDVLFGGKGDNLLLSGSTVYGQNDAAMAAIFNEWNRPIVSYAARVTDLKQGGGLNGPYTLNASTLVNNSTGSLLVGGAGTDWFLFNTRDYIFGQKRGEVLTKLA